MLIVVYLINRPKNNRLGSTVLSRMYYSLVIINASGDCSITDPVLVIRLRNPYCQFKARPVYLPGSSKAGSMHILIPQTYFHLDFFSEQSPWRLLYSELDSSTLAPNLALSIQLNFVITESWSRVFCSVMQRLKTSRILLQTIKMWA